MEILSLPMAEALAEAARPDDPPLEEREMDILAFQLWQKANLPAMAEPADESEEETRRSRASCL